MPSQITMPLPVHGGRKYYILEVMDTSPSRPPPSLLRSFFNPAQPLELKRWDGAIQGTGVYYDPVPLESLTALPEAVVAGPGAVRIPFDPEEALARLTEERGPEGGRPFYTLSPFESHIVPAALRWFLLHNDVRKRLLDRNAFPRWPAEPCAEGIRALVLDAARRAGIAPKPAPFWPDGRKFAAALSHDVDSVQSWKKGNWRAFADLEESLGLRSSWHVCTSHLKWAEKAVEELASRGHEIAWHGPRHDYRLAWMPANKRAAIIWRNQAFFNRFKVRGFRSPNFLRTPALLESLEGVFGYDSSSLDTAAEPFHPRARTGCSTVFPFFRGNLLEMPITIPDGLTIRCLTGEDSAAISAVQAEKVDWIKSIGGMALAITHPEDWISMRPALFESYRRLVEKMSADRDAWRALPRDIEAWWRKRQAGGTA